MADQLQHDEDLQPIEVFEKIVRLRPVEWVPHTSGAWVVEAGGREWIHKPVMGNNEVLAEAIGLLLGNRLGVDTPPAAVFREGSNVSWMSNIISNVVHWEPAKFASLDNPHSLSAIYVLDAIIKNEDRHARNVLLQELGNSRCRIWSIDTADAFIGTPSDLVGDCSPPRPSNHLRDPPLDAATCADAMQVASAAAALPPSALRRDAVTACAISACPDLEQQLAEVLIARCKDARAILNAYLELLR